MYIYIYPGNLGIPIFDDVTYAALLVVSFTRAAEQQRIRFALSRLCIDAKIGLNRSAGIP